MQFEYPARPGEPVLNGLSFKLQANKMTAIVGDSGAGKSTISKLLMRMYDPSNCDEPAATAATADTDGGDGTQSAILIDGVDMRDFDLRSLHEKIGVVSQVRPSV